ncbi:MAG: TetR/AcrR family transcriptional regulator [Chitinophagaceae bacterium]|nr:TetR/AcrR family transcriptional regulator [Anaerolineae bacterium]
MAEPTLSYHAKLAREKRNAVINAAVDLFLERGYERTSLQDIAKAAGISTGTIFKHFPTKAALFGEIMARVWEATPEAVPLVPAAGNARAGLTLIGQEYARLLRQPNIEPLFRVIIAEAPRFPELGQALYEQGKKPYLDRLHAYLAAETGSGALEIDDIPLAARQFLGMINDVIFWPRFLVVDLVVTDKEVTRVVDGAVETFLARYGRSGILPPNL